MQSRSNCSLWVSMNNVGLVSLISVLPHFYLATVNVDFEKASASSWNLDFIELLTFRLRAEFTRDNSYSVAGHIIECDAVLDQPSGAAVDSNNGIGLRPLREQHAEFAVASPNIDQPIGIHCALDM